MARDFLHAEPFDEATLTKLELFQLYTREWLPVFTAPEKPWWKEINIFDFFAGPGLDTKGVIGSPLRTLTELTSGDHLSRIREKGLRVKVWFSDKSATKIQRLIETISACGFVLPDVEVNCEAGTFEEMFTKALPVMQRSDAANLVIIDQYGVKQVSDDVFRTLLSLDRTDFLFFVSSSYLHRFNDHPAIKRYIEFKRPEDYYQVHNFVLDHYRSLIPKGHNYWLAPYSIKKGSNVYGIIFGSRHPLGMEKFLRVAWRQDEVNGEANFDIGREGLSAEQPTLDFVRPKKVEVFETDLRGAILAGKLNSEPAIYRFCLERGMTPSHSRAVLHALKKGKRIEADFDVPRIESLKVPRQFRVVS